MAYKKEHNLFAGGKYGCFKGILCTSNGTTSKNLQNINYINTESHISVMKWADKDERELLLATANQTVKVYNTKCRSFVESIPAKCGQGAICGVSRYKGILITAVESGQIRLWTSNDSNNDVEVLDPEDLDIQVKPIEEASLGTDIIAGNNLSCMQHNQYDVNIIGSGGRDSDLKLWDLSTKQNVFSAKNQPDDAVRLTEPIWVSDIAFLPDNKTVAVCSRYGYVRLYDPRAQRRPTCVVKVPEQALTCISVSDEQKFVCGLAKGDMIMVDTRTKAVACKYKGYLGAVCSVVCHPTAPYIASASLDRHVRIHHRDTKELLAKEYLKLPLNCIVMRSEFDFNAVLKSSKKRKQEPDDIDDLDNMLNSLEKVEEPQNTKKRLFVNPFASNSAIPQGSLKSDGSDSNEDSEEVEEEEDDDDDGDDEEEEEEEEDDSEDFDQNSEDEDGDDDDCIMIN